MLPAASGIVAPRATYGGRTKAKITKAKSALELFRDSFFDELRLGGETINPCKTYTWQRVRTAWEQLDAERRSIFEQRAEAAKSIADKARKNHRSPQQQQPQRQIQQPLQQQSELTDGAGGEDGRTSPSVHVAIGQVDLPARPEQALSQGYVSPAVTPTTPQEYPLSAERLEKGLEGGVTKCANLFKDAAARIIVAAPGGFGKVKYPTQCQGLCANSTEGYVLDMQTWIVESLLAACKKTDKTEVVLGRLFVLEVDESAGDDLFEEEGDEVGGQHRLYIMLIDMLGKHGRHRASQRFAYYAPTGLGVMVGPDYIGVKLEVVREGRVAGHQELPSVFELCREGGQGRVREGSGHDVAKHALLMCGQRWPSKVTIKRMDHVPRLNEDRPDIFDIESIGVQDGFEAIEICARGPRPPILLAIADGPAPGPGPEGEQPEVPEQPADEHGVAAVDEMFGLDQDVPVSGVPDLRADLQGMFPERPAAACDEFLDLWSLLDDDGGGAGDPVVGHPPGDLAGGQPPGPDPEDGDVQIDEPPTPPEQLLHTLGLQVHPPAGLPSDVLVVASGAKIGRMHSMWGTTFKCVCRKHLACSLMMLRRWQGDERTLCTMYKWLSKSAVMSEQEHWSATQAIIRDARDSMA